ncbi:alpha/beta fold hydrolase [Paenibacillus sp. BC26]|uniref:alpha/beta fold hydrolase n=1 Tax=Paenibacillus sp. BC26 TaxID=1881032 RepID=UPI0008E41C54|nr:alpha/beta hydrolase [Paenibacillus sp. BC26]SFS73041.1 Pimeloyl-ACP methyl ester carboxylesterase [Paenibacillus sp. BC26]
MTTFVLVHGAWGGGWNWRFVAKALRAAGYEVHTPTLTGMGDRAHLGHALVNLDTHVQDVINVLYYENLKNVVLVGHSYGGMPITGVADLASDRLERLVYLDAALPDDGQSFFDVYPDGRDWWESRALKGDGWVKLDTAEFPHVVEAIPDKTIRDWFIERMEGQLQPIGTLTQPVRIRKNQVPRTFIYCTQMQNNSRDAAKAKADPNMEYMEIQTNHFAPFSAPELVVESLLKIAKMNTKIK